MEKDKCFYETIYGPGIENEQDALRLCLEKIAFIKAVIDIKGINMIETYLCGRLQDIRDSEKK